MMVRLRFVALSSIFFASLVVLPVVATADPILTNGGFETPTLTSSNAPDGFLDISVGGESAAGFTGWKVTTNNVDVFVNGVLGSSATVYEGTQALDLVGFDSTGGISQSFTTDIGQMYSLSFAYGNNPGSTSTASAEVVVSDGNGILLDTTITHSTSSATDYDWTLFSQTFTASSLTTKLSFTETVGQQNGGVLLDAVSVDETSPAGVPEPSTLALAGLGGLFMSIKAIRRRRAALV